MKTGQDVSDVYKRGICWIIFEKFSLIEVDVFCCIEEHGVTRLEQSERSNRCGNERCRALNDHHGSEG